jgi:hypothetical protein
LGITMTLTPQSQKQRAQMFLVPSGMALLVLNGVASGAHPGLAGSIFLALASLAAIGCFIVGCSLYAQSRGGSKFLGLLGIGFLLGLLTIYVFTSPKRRR